MLWRISLCFLLSAAAPALAVEPPIAYSRTAVTVERHAVPQGVVNANLRFDVETRSAESAARVPGWYNFVTLAEGKAAMLTFPVPQAFTVEPSGDYAPVDVLLLDAYGAVREILPSLVPAEMEESIASAEPVLAVMYVKGGTCAAANIQPGDVARHAMFKKKPVVLNAPVPLPPAPAPVR